jgi:hypothetical protein
MAESNAAFMLSHCASACAVCANETIHAHAVATELGLAAGDDAAKEQACHSPDLI